MPKLIWVQEDLLRRYNHDKFTTYHAVGVNHYDAKEELLKILDKIFELNPSNIGSYETVTIFSGATIEDIKAQLSEISRVRCCFSEKEKIKKLVKYIKNNEFGLSVTLSGLTEEIISQAEELEIEPHSINLSLGIFWENRKITT